MVDQSRTPLAEQLLGLATELGHLRPLDFLNRRRINDIRRRMLTLTQGVARTERFQAEVLAEVAEEEGLRALAERRRIGEIGVGKVVSIVGRMRRARPELAIPPAPRGAA